jgi:hypothetical protein
MKSDESRGMKERNPSPKMRKSRVERMRMRGIARQTADARRVEAKRKVPTSMSGKIAPSGGPPWCMPLGRNSSTKARNGIPRRKRVRRLDRQITAARRTPANKMPTGRPRPRKSISSGSTKARNGITRKKRTDGVDRQATTASGIPVSKTTAKANRVPAKKTSCANMRGGCAATTLLSVSFCEKRKHRAMKSAPIKAAKIRVN